MRFFLKRITRAAAATLFLLMLGAAPLAVMAAPDACGCDPSLGSCPPCAQPCDPSVTTCPTGAPGQQVDGGDGSSVNLDNPLGTDDVRVVIARFVQLMTGISGSIALAAFVWGGFQWLTAAGDSSKIEQGKNTLKYAVLGLVMIFGAYVAVSAVFAVIGGSV